MPTYDYVCAKCGQKASMVQSISSYIEKPRIPDCPQHGAMDRCLSVVPAFSGLANALAGDRHYEGLRAPDGTDISSRSKHREYMKRNGLTTQDDFKGQWAKADKERAEIREGTRSDREIREIVTEKVMKAVAE